MEDFLSASWPAHPKARSFFSPHSFTGRQWVWAFSKTHASTYTDFGLFSALGVLLTVEKMTGS